MRNRKDIYYVLKRQVQSRRPRSMKDPPYKDHETRNAGNVALRYAALRVYHPRAGDGCSRDEERRATVALYEGGVAGPKRGSGRWMGSEDLSVRGEKTFRLETRCKILAPCIYSSVKSE